MKQNSEVNARGWFDHDYLGIDQGPILIMAENYRSGLVWEVMKKSPYLVRGLQRAGFSGGWLADREVADVEPVISERQAEPGAMDEGTRLVVVLGSSTAEGTGPEASSNARVNRYRTYLQTVDPRFEVLNLARGGYSTSRLLPTADPVPDGHPAPDPLRNIEAALARSPEAILINMPSNDAASGFGVDEQMRHFDRVIAVAKAAGVPVWVTTSQPRNLDAQGRRIQLALRDAILERYGSRAIDFWTGFATDDGGQALRWDSGDNNHYNDEAHALFFERVQAADIIAVLDSIRASGKR